MSSKFEIKNLINGLENIKCYGLMLVYRCYTKKRSLKTILIINHNDKNNLGSYVSDWNSQSMYAFIYQNMPSLKFDIIDKEFIKYGFTKNKHHGEIYYTIKVSDMKKDFAKFLLFACKKRLLTEKWYSY